MTALAQLFNQFEIVSDPEPLAKISEDYFRFSPILAEILTGKRAALGILPSSEAEVLAIAQICVAHRLPITVRGSGTGNYGQAVPLQGGVVIDLSKLQQIPLIKPGLVGTEPGVKLGKLERAAREINWELRMIPSTFRTATVGGFIAGGSGGIGSILYGQLRDRGNLKAARVVTLEDHPQIIELRGDRVQSINHAYGTNGIITYLELPLAPAYEWAEVVVEFADFSVAMEFGMALGKADGIIKRMISIHQHPIPSFFTALRSFLHAQHCLLVLVNQADLKSLIDLVNEYGGLICYQKSAIEAGKGASLIEYSWNHTTLHARNADSNWTYLQSIFPDLKTIEQMIRYFGGEILMHLELIRLNGEVVPAAIQLVKFTTAARMNQIIEFHEQHGVLIANPHTYLLEDGGMKQVNYDQLRFKQQVDPYGLCNPGKMRAFLDH
ncbi:MAG: FAD-binding oxidoreductase [Pseudanabaenaceae cyanobacterium bins.68]|nr:FAD-binding oxidoreductase [Pseudanabaenaceae cyanobacterium bins.68]